MPGQGDRQERDQGQQQQVGHPRPAHRETDQHRQHDGEDERPRPRRRDLDLPDGPPHVHRLDRLPERLPGGVRQGQRHQQRRAQGPYERRRPGGPHRPVAVDVEHAAALRGHEEGREEQRTDRGDRGDLRDTPDRRQPVGGERAGIGDTEQHERLRRGQSDHDRCDDRRNDAEHDIQGGRARSWGGGGFGFGLRELGCCHGYQGRTCPESPTTRRRSTVSTVTTASASTMGPRPRGSFRARGHRVSVAERGFVSGRQPEDGAIDRGDDVGDRDVPVVVSPHSP